MLRRTAVLYVIDKWLRSNRERLWTYLFLIIKLFTVAACDQEINGLPILTGCPADTEYFLVMGATGGAGAGLYALRSWLTLKNCILAQLFGDGIETINGSQLDGSNQYMNSDLIDQLLVFYNGVNRFLIHDDSDETYPASEWKYLKSGTDVIGIQILIPAVFTSADIFTIFPNPNGNP
jgi:hypothetical protein